MQIRVNAASPFARKARIVIREAGLLAALERAQTAFGSQFGIGQIGAACVLGYLDFRFPEIDWRVRHPNLKAWFEVASGRPSVRDTFPQA